MPKCTGNVQEKASIVSRLTSDEGSINGELLYAIITGSQTNALTNIKAKICF